jgi:hypothetical protein
MAGLPRTFYVSKAARRFSSAGAARGAGAVFLALALVGAIPAVASAAEGPPDGEAKEVTIYLPSPTDPRYVLELHLFPGSGVAVVDTYQRVGGESLRAAAYAIAIPTVPFSGSLHLEFPGLGDIVGTIAPVRPREAGAEAKLCTSDYPSEAATFDGHLAFQGAGGYASWRATKARAGILLACGEEPRRANGPAALFGRVSENGLVLNGQARIQFNARGKVRRREVEFVAFADRSSGTAEFAGVDREWLHGDVATERWTKEEPVSLGKTVDFGSDAGEPASVTFAPPAPFFFGRGVYRRSTGKLTGSIGSRFLGLTLHLTPSPIGAKLFDEELSGVR